MGRNPEADARARVARRQQLIEDAFHIFAEKTIDKLSMNEVADACGVGIATLYRHFSSKNALVLAVSTWAWEQAIRRSLRTPGGGMSAAEDYEYFLDSFLTLYRDHRDVLRFNQFFNVYVQSEEIAPEQMSPYMTVIGALAERFHGVYERGRRDGTLRTDVPERELFSTSLHLMLAAVTRYAVGLVYDGGVDPEAELQFQKNLLLRAFTVDPGAN
jgi:AcrR family transcriptional regulator